MSESAGSEVDPDWYLTRYGDVASAGADPVEHYALYGRAEGRYPNAASEALHRSASNLDPTWYRARYPDIAAADVDPAAHHIAFGALEGRHPDAESERRQRLLNAFDPVWYLARNRDVAASGAPPLQHFLTHGQAEGRSACVEQETRSFWKNWFDPAWYVARYSDVKQSGLPPLDHYLTIGIYENRAPTSAAEDRAQWTGIFDADWYTMRYKDVASLGISPLEHFITFGIVGHRKPNSTVALRHAPIEDAGLVCIKESGLTEHVALFVTHTPTATLKPHLRHHLEALRDARLSIVLIIATDAASVHVHPDIEALADIIFVRQNRGFDFAAWAHVMRKRPEVLASRTLYLVNDSTIGPFGSAAFGNLSRQIEARAADIIGLTDNHELGWHLQSYFLVLKHSALRSEAVKNFFDSVVSYYDKNDVINEYETQFTGLMAAAGLRCDALFKTDEPINHTAFRWRELIDRGFPYLKVTLLSRLITRADIVGWRDHLTARGYDTALADKTLAEITATSSALDPFENSLEPKRRRDLLENLHRFFARHATLPIPAVSEPALSIVILAQNHAEYLFEILNNALRSRIIEIAEIIIVNYKSSDDTEYLLSRAANVRVAHTSEDASLAGAYRVGLAMARGRYVLMMDQPRFVSENFFTHLHTALIPADLQISITVRRRRMPNQIGAAGTASSVEDTQNALRDWDIIADEKAGDPRETTPYLWLSLRSIVETCFHLDDVNDLPSFWAHLRRLQAAHESPSKDGQDDINLFTV